MIDKREDVFRKRVVARLSVPDELTEPLAIARPRDWLILAGLGLIVGSAIVWAAIGRLAVTVQGAGVLHSSAATQEIRATVPAQVLRVRAVSGATVDAGSPLIELQPATLRKSDGTARDQNGNQNAKLQTIVSPFRARVVEIAVKPGDDISADTRLLTLEPADAELQAVLFLPDSMAGQIHSGLEVWLSPKAFPAQQYGLLHGIVSNVAPSPTSDAGVKQLLRDEAFARSCLQQHMRVRVDVKLRRDEGQPDRHWPSGNGADQPLDTGAQVNGEIVLNRERPIQWVLPWLR
jgi:multidrug efflux pump subunit AcrA (membrane-fusion protein)